MSTFLASFPDVSRIPNNSDNQSCDKPMPHPEEHVNYLSSEENRPKVGTGVNCLEPKVTRGTKTNLGTGYRSY